MIRSNRIKKTQALVISVSCQHHVDGCAKMLWAHTVVVPSGEGGWRGGGYITPDVSYKWERAGEVGQRHVWDGKKKSYR